MLNDSQEKIGTHIMLRRSDYLILCGFAGSVDREVALEVDRRANSLICDKKVIKSANTGKVIAKYVDSDEQ